MGAQGGDVDALAEALKDHEGIPMINSSRGIIYAGREEENWADHVAESARRTKELISKITEQYVAAS